MGFSPETSSGQHHPFNYAPSFFSLAVGYNRWCCKEGCRTRGRPAQKTRAPSSPSQLELLQAQLQQQLSWIQQLQQPTQHSNQGPPPLEGCCSRRCCWRLQTGNSPWLDFNRPAIVLFTKIQFYSSLT